MSILEELWYGNIKPCEDKEISDEEKKLVPELGKMKLSEISTVTCQQLINKLYTDGRSRGRTKKGNGLSLYTVKGIKRALNICLQKAVEVDLLLKNPCTKVKMPNGEKPEMKTLKKKN